MERDELVPSGDRDNDRMLVLLLMALLWKNGASKELIIALAYIAMG